jgi:hypothetical protein
MRPDNITAPDAATEDTDNVVALPRRLRRSVKPPPRPRCIRALEAARYTLAHCAQLGYIPEKYWDAFLDLAEIIAERRR